MKREKHLEGPLPVIRRASFHLLLSLAIWGTISIAKTCEAVEITDSVNFVDPIIDGESASTWSPDGKQVMLAEFHKKDQSIHLCIYDAKTRNKEQCVYFLKPEPDVGISSINWTDDFLHVAVGFSEGGTVILRLPVPDWKSPNFKERNIASVKALPETYGAPAWDHWEKGLFFHGEDETFGIQLLKNGKKPQKYVSGQYPAVTQHYLWYSSLTEDGNLSINGIARVEKATGKKTRLTTMHDVSISPRADEKAALFIRRQSRTGKPGLYAYVEGKGITGPLISSNKKIGEEFGNIKLSPDGEYALLTSAAAHKTDKLKAVVTIKMLSLRW